MNARAATNTGQSGQPVTWLTGVLQRKCGCGNHTVAGGSCADCEKKKTAGLQTKLTIGEAGDVYEREADQIADQVMSSPAHGSVKGAPVQVQRYAGASGASADSVPASVGHTLGQAGSPLPRTVRQNMEQRFGHDFSQVRVHSSASAAESARDVNAQAYTVGHNIVFGAGRFAPDTQPGQRLLAHELTHVVQQRGGFSPAIQRQPEGEDKEKGPQSDLGKEINKNETFQKLPKFARDKILDEIDKLPQTATQAMVDKIIDLAPIDPQYKEGLKKAAEAIITVLGNRTQPSVSICDRPGYHQGGSSTFKGMCCRGTIERAEDCCPVDKFAPKDDRFCCGKNQYVSGAGKCEDFSPSIYENICILPARKDKYGMCCFPPFRVIDGLCTSPGQPQPPPQPLNLDFKLGTLDDFNINESRMNSRQKPHYDEIKNEIARFLEVCPASLITIIGFADKPGTEEHNFELGQRRADHVKFVLQLDLIRMRVNPLGMTPFILTRSEGEANPVDVAAGEKYSPRNRRVEIRFNSICPPLSEPSLKMPTFQPPWKPNWSLFNPENS